MTTTRVFVILSLTTRASRVFLMVFPFVGTSIRAARLRRPADVQFALAEHGLRPREISLGLPDARGVLGNTHRELKPQIEQLLGQVLRLLRELVARHVVPLDGLHPRLRAVSYTHLR